MKLMGAMAAVKQLITGRLGSRRWALLAIAAAWGAVYPLSVLFHGWRFGWPVFGPPDSAWQAFVVAVAFAGLTLPHAFANLLSYLAGLDGLRGVNWGIVVAYWLCLLAFHVGFVLARRLVLLVIIALILLGSAVMNFELLTSALTIT